MQVVAQAVAATGSLDDATLSAFTRETTFSTVMGDVSFGRKGEWVHPRVLQIQFQGIDGHGVEQFKDGSRQAVVIPRDIASRPFIYPYASAIG